MPFCGDFSLCCTRFFLLSRFTIKFQKPIILSKLKTSDKSVTPQIGASLPLVLNDDHFFHSVIALECPSEAVAVGPAVCSCSSDLAPRFRFSQLEICPLVHAYPEAAEDSFQKSTEDPGQISGMLKSGSLRVPRLWTCECDIRAPCNLKRRPERLAESYSMLEVAALRSVSCGFAIKGGRIDNRPYSSRIVSFAVQRW